MGSIAALIFGTMVCQGSWAENAKGNPELTLDAGCHITQAQCESAAAYVETDERRWVVSVCSRDMHAVEFISQAEAAAKR